MKAQLKPSSVLTNLNTNAGGAGPGRVRRSPARQGKAGEERRVPVRIGGVGQCRLGEARRGMEWRGQARQVRLGLARRGAFRFSTAG
jgi:hypothetical protein